MPPLPAFALGLAIGGAVWPGLRPDVHLAFAACAALLALAAVVGRPRGRLVVVAGALALLAAGVAFGLALLSARPDGVVLSGEVWLRGRVDGAAVGAEAPVFVTHGPATGGRVRVRFPGVPPTPGVGVLVRGRAAPVPTGALAGAVDPSWATAAEGVAVVVRASEVTRLGAPPWSPRVDGARHAGLLRAMLDGARDGIDPESARVLKATGTWHLVSISGLHVGLCAAAAAACAAMSTRPLVWLGAPVAARVITAAVGVGAAFAYAALAGWPIPARRAAWMVAVAAATLVLGRSPGRWEALSLAWVGCVVVEPDAVHDLTAQLSFGALIGIFLVERSLLRLLPPDLPWWAKALAGALVSTVGATAGTLPVTALHFQDLPLVTPLANLVAVPVAGSIGTPALLASQVLPGPAGAACLWVADASLTLTLLLLGPLAEAPRLHPAVGPVGAAMLCVAMGCARRPVLLVALVVLALGLGPRVRGPTVTFLAVGQGDGATIEWPDGRVWLVDGGPPGGALLAYLRRRRVSVVDRVVVSHAHPDHLGGLEPVLRALRVRRVHAPRAARDALATMTTAPVELGADAQESSSNRHFGRDGGWLALHPRPGFAGPRGDPANDESLVIRVEAGGQRVLFTGDVEAAAERALLAEDVAADVLKVPHHGSRTSSSAALVAAVGARHAVVSCGASNRYGHPHAITLATLRGSRVWRTDRDGSIRFVLGGDQPSVSAARAGARSATRAPPPEVRTRRTSPASRSALSSSGSSS